MTASSPKTDYRSAVLALNRLQSNAANLEQALLERDARCGEKIPEIVRLAERIGISIEEYNSLRVIHITGTKGKGGTAAYVESILRSHGYRTGFFSSPHLVEVRERIRINGRPLSQEAFAEYFWFTHDHLSQNPGPDPMPAYFPFLTLMAVWAFLSEKVDVAVMEVGIGGRYDSTNFVTDPWVCAISSLGLDHTTLLGNTIGLIASQKAGILKPGCIGITVEGQPEEGMAMLIKEANTIGCPLLVAPPITTCLDFPDWLKSLAPSQLCNASLAAAVCKIWLDRKHAEERCGGEVQSPSAQPEREQRIAHLLAQLHDSRLPPTFLSGLQSARWAGRNSIMALPGAVNSTTLYIDGAHTVESIVQTAKWFNRCTSESPRPKVLLFNRTGDRKAADLLGPLADNVAFQAALFCPNAVADLSQQSLDWPDLANISISLDLAASRVAENLEAFRSLKASSCLCECEALTSVAEAVNWLLEYDKRLGGCNVLVTGSLHLVGCLFARLAPGIAL